MPYLTWPSRVPAEQVHRRALARLGQALDRGELGRLVRGDLASVPVADEHLHRRGQRRDGQRDRQRGALVAAPAAAQPAEGVGAGDQEADRRCSRPRTCGRARARSSCCRTAPSTGCTSTASPPLRRKPVGWFIQALTEITISEPVKPGDHDRDAAGEVSPRRQPIPAVDVDADEDRLDEERESLDREAEAEDTEPNVAMKFGHRRPISKLRIVPVTTPTANSATMIFVQRLASVAVELVAACADRATRRTSASPGRRSRSRPAGCARRTTAPASGGPRAGSPGGPAPAPG